MKKHLFLLVFPMLLSGASVPPQDLCEVVYGTIYVETDRRRADYLVYKEEKEAFADLLIYEEVSRAYADRPGIWFFTTNRALADYTIFYVKEKGQAHLSTFLIETESFAGCN